jgi:signal peptidase I
MSALDAQLSRRNSWLRFFALAAMTTLAFIGARLWFIDGLVRRVLIDGPSMVPTFCGEHYETQCRDCHFRLMCDAANLPSDGLAACPNCGCTKNKLADARLLPADRVLIDRWPLLFRGPRRGEVVAFRASGNSGELVIKRVVGLPGERISIAGGNLYLNGEQLHKSPDESKRWPDVHYLDPAGLPRDWTAPAPLAADEYFLLGDNQPVSIDSRHWGGINRKAILGLVRPRFSKQP